MIHLGVLIFFLFIDVGDFGLVLFSSFGLLDIGFFWLTSGLGNWFSYRMFFFSFIFKFDAGDFWTRFFLLYRQLLYLFSFLSSGSTVTGLCCAITLQTALIYHSMYSLLCAQIVFSLNIPPPIFLDSFLFSSDIATCLLNNSGLDFFSFFIFRFGFGSRCGSSFS